MAKPLISFQSPAMLQQKNPWGGVMSAGDPTQASINEATSPPVGMDMPSAQSPVQMSAGGPLAAALPPEHLTALQRQIEKVKADNAAYMGAANKLQPIQEQQRRLAGLDALNANALSAVPNQEDISPMLGLIDQYTGSKMAGAYKRPMSPQERAQMVMQTADSTQKGHEALLKDTLGQGKAMQADALAEQNKAQAAKEAGFTIDEDGNISETPGGLAEAKRKDILSQMNQRNMMGSYYYGKNAASSAGADSKALNQTQQLLESARGNPAVGQAQKDLYSTKKINSLINLYGDPNNLNPQQVQLVASEVAKIAQGGVPSMHELEGLNPTTIPKSLASMAQMVTNSPSPANAGAFLKQFQDYSDALAKDANGVIQEKFGRVLETRKRSLHPDDYAMLQSKYMGAAPAQSQATPPAPSVDKDAALAEARRRGLVK